MEPPGLDISKDVVDIPVEGMFASADWKVINREGENYYRACSALVYEMPEGGASHCVKPTGHRTSSHEDSCGRETQRHYGVQDMESKTRIAAHQILRRTGIEEAEVFNVLNALQYGGFKLSREPTS